MGDWETILFERRVLWWTTLLVLLGTGLWLVALATPYWIIHIAGPDHERGLVWGHSGVWRKCDLVDSEHGLRWECWYTLSFQSALIRSELSLAGSQSRGTKVGWLLHFNLNGAQLRWDHCQK